MSANDRRRRNPRRHGHADLPTEPVKIRLQPLSEKEFQVSRNHAIPKLAADYVRRGIWAEGAALETSRAEFAQLFPQGLDTRDKHLLSILDDETGLTVGEVWYTAQTKGGMV